MWCVVTLGIHLWCGGTGGLTFYTALVGPVTVNVVGGGKVTTLYRLDTGPSTGDDDVDGQAVAE